MRHGRFDAARQLFDQMPRRTIVSWNTMLSGYLSNDQYSSALWLFDAMPHRDEVSWNTMINGHVRYDKLGAARRMFEQMPMRDIVSWNTMISAYAQSGQVEQAQEIFDRAPVKDSVSWNGILAAYLQNGRFEAAQVLFESNPYWDTVSWNAMIAGYLRRNRLVDAQQLFDRVMFDEMPERNIVTWNAIVAAYVQNKRMDEAEELFNVMPCKNISSWNTMVTGYAQSGHSEEALQLFIEMGRSGERMNRSSFTCAFSTCADIAVLECGMQVHGRLVKAGYGLGCFVGNALLSMYFKCGNIDEAYKAYEEISQKDVVTWNTMIVGYARHGFGDKALESFDLMRTTEMKPDNVTLVGVLSACSHAGLINKGIDFFYSMHQDFGIKPKAEHYTCMIDLLGRAGRLAEAQALIKDLPFEPDATMWGALLGASRIHRHTELGRKAAEKIFEMEPNNAGMYVLLSNLYASSGSWAEASKLRAMMQDRGVRKVPGFSWIEVDNRVHTFSVGDNLHPEKAKIYAFLEELDMKMKKAGYVSATNLVLHDVEEEEKEQMLKFHSEKLAVAYGILRLTPGRPVRVIKNLRICEDCHDAIKYISLIENRLIILRDSNRFHHFSCGSCSCRDYW
ncbi:Pentatricopeptide repeat-containing protein [Dendrobium catenatum]|uniref:Pentatricopeptide repeat-containing protein n=1 Tax=Dendrobium catenatum TaxID=906689 RepID=A0A2I0W3W9_9ASPA|nr:Pentatricopeptide repeat-containing protein [Dendrobium catenatum]